MWPARTLSHSGHSCQGQCQTHTAVMLLTLHAFRYWTESWWTALPRLVSEYCCGCTQPVPLETWWVQLWISIISADDIPLSARTAMYDGHSGQGHCQGLAIVGIHINVGVTVKPLSDCAHTDPDEHSGHGECQDSAGVGIYVNVSVKVNASSQMPRSVRRDIGVRVNVILLSVHASTS